MQLTDYKNDFLTQLQEEQQKIQQHTQQALKLQGAIEAIDLIIKNSTNTIDAEIITVNDETISPKKRKVKSPYIINDLIEEFN